MMAYSLNLTNHSMSIEDLNNDLYETNKIPIIFIGLFTPIGILGNFIVFYIYMCCLKSSTLNFLVENLALLDLICCFTALPLSVIKLRFPVLHPSTTLCKFENFSVMFYCLASGLILTAISIERFNRICRPEKQQISRRSAIYIAALAYCSSVIVSLPDAWFTDLTPIYIHGITIQICSQARALEQTAGFLLILSFIIIAIGFIALMIIILILNYWIWKTVRHHLQYTESRTHNLQKIKETNKKIKKMNITVLCIIILFFLSFTPELIVYFPLDTTFTQNGIIAKTLFKHMWVLNCTLNPLVYGFFNQDFRNEFMNIWTKCISCKTVISSSS